MDQGGRGDSWGCGGEGRQGKAREAERSISNEKKKSAKERKKKPPAKRNRTNETPRHSLEMHRDRRLGPHHPRQLDPLPRVHRDHGQRQPGPRHRRAPQVQEQEVDARVPIRDGGEFGHEQRVAGDVDAEGRGEGGRGGGGGGGGGGGVAEFEHPAVGGGDLGGVEVRMGEGERVGEERGAGESPPRRKTGMDIKPTAPKKSFTFPTHPPGPGGTCFPGMAVTLTAASPPAIRTKHSSHTSRSVTAVKASAGPLDAAARCDLACGVVMMGRSVGGGGQSLRMGVDWKKRGGGGWKGVRGRKRDGTYRGGGTLRQADQNGRW